MKWNKSKENKRGNEINYQKIVFWSQSKNHCKENLKEKVLKWWTLNGEKKEFKNKKIVNIYERE